VGGPRFVDIDPRGGGNGELHLVQSHMRTFFDIYLRTIGNTSMQISTVIPGHVSLLIEDRPHCLRCRG